MKVCLVASPRALTPAKPGNSLFVQTHGLASALAALGHSVDVIALGAQAQPEEAYNIHSIRGLNFLRSNLLSRVLNELYFSLATVKTIRRLSIQNKPDVVLFDASMPAAFFALLFTHKKSIPPFLCRFHGTVPALSLEDKAVMFPAEWHEPKVVTIVSLVLQRYVLKRVSQVILVSNTVKQRLIRSFNLNPAKLVVIPPGMDSDLFQPEVDCSELREKYGLPENTPIIVCVAKIAAYKNQLSLVRAMPQILAKHPDAKFMFVGPVSSNQYYSKIQELVRAYSLDKHVIFTGSVINAELPRYYSLCDVFVLPSIAEGLPGVLIEAMSCGKAVVASSIPQNREAARHGDEAIFVSPLDSDALAEAINNLLGSPDLRKTLGNNARRTALEYFDWKMVARQMAQVYEEVLKMPD